MDNQALTFQERQNKLAWIFSLKVGDDVLVGEGNKFHISRVLRITDLGYPVVDNRIYYSDGTVLNSEVDRTYRRILPVPVGNTKSINFLPPELVPTAELQALTLQLIADRKVFRDNNLDENNFPLPDPQTDMIDEINRVLESRNRLAYSGDMTKFPLPLMEGSIRALAGKAHERIVHYDTIYKRVIDAAYFTDMCENMSASTIRRHAEASILIKEEWLWEIKGGHDEKPQAYQKKLYRTGLRRLSDPEDYRSLPEIPDALK